MEFLQINTFYTTSRVDFAFLPAHRGQPTCAHSSYNSFFFGKRGKNQSQQIIYLPIRARTPHPSHTTKLKPTDPVLINTPLGEINIPEPANRN